MAALLCRLAKSDGAISSGGTRKDGKFHGQATGLVNKKPFFAAATTSAFENGSETLGHAIEIASQ
jgi:hypothetical protein